MAVITVGDLQKISPDIDEAKAQAMIDDAVAQATLVAPCLLDEDTLTDAQKAQFKAVLRSAIIRWDDAGNSAATNESETAGAVSHSITVDSSRLRKGLFWPSEIDQLQKVCGTARQSGTHDTTGRSPFAATWLDEQELGSPDPDHPLAFAAINGPDIPRY